MSNAHTPNGNKIPKLGRVNEICQEWMVREDGAMAYQLQNQEIKQHYSGNKQRNALVREDYPKAKNEQQKEQELAEQAAAVYRRMLEEQEEIDKMMAERLTHKLEFEERIRKKMEEREGLQVAKKLQDKFGKPPVLRQLKPQKEIYQQSGNSVIDEMDDILAEEAFSKRDLQPSNQTEVISTAASRLHSEEVVDQKTQEEADEELARMLQEQEGNPEECILQRDRLLAIEAQDKELAKVLQERERLKARKAKERARQKALVKKQQKKQDGTMSNDVIMPDDAYSNPADMIPQRNRITAENHSMNGSPLQYEEYEDNYSLPVDRLDSLRLSNECGIPEYPNCATNKEEAPRRPSHLNIKQTYKPRLPNPGELGSKQHSNIAMAIDPTYVKQEPAQSSPGSHSQHMSPMRSVSSKSSSKSSPSSSSKEAEGKLEMGNAPPYMPIQGQKRTASLEKRRVRDGCKQQ
ncbi:hypothetical protein HHI36_018409 [Cryptolaemus montrouzieri]|uniref:Coiled-coil domain-containing protein n=1 Tax=Cryptolaemus montrouzieri TaxID=559131 RepID=A0ABD2P0T5_9CUCU